MDGTQRLNITFSYHTELIVPFNGPNCCMSAWLCLVLLPFYVKDCIISVIRFCFLSENKLSFLLLSIFASFEATLASKALLV